MAVQPYDIFILAIIVLATVFGAWKGMAWQLASIASVVVSAIVAMRFSEQATQVIPFLDPAEPWSRFVAIAILFLGTSLCVWLIFRMVAGVIDRVRLKEFDRQAGALFGLAKGILFALIVTFFAVTLSENSRQWVLNSKSGKYAAILVQKGTPMMPPDIREALAKYIEEFDRKLDPTTPPDESYDIMTAVDELQSESGQGVPLPNSLTNPFPDERPPAWDPELWRSDAERAAGENFDAISDRLNSELNSATDRFFDAADRRLDELGQQFQSPSTGVNR